MEKIESSINRYLVALDTADLQEPAVAQAQTERLQDKITALKAQTPRPASVSPAAVFTSS